MIFLRFFFLVPPLICLWIAGYCTSANFFYRIPWWGHVIFATLQSLVMLCWIGLSWKLFWCGEATLPPIAG